MKRSKKRGMSYILLIFLLMIFLIPGLVKVFQRDPTPNEWGVEEIGLDTEGIYF